jgi:integrase
MAKQKITKRAVEKLAQGETLFDTDVPGFYVRRQIKRPSYGIKFRLNGRQGSFAIGTHGIFSPDQARRKARELLVGVQNGIDPREEKRRQKQGLTVADAIKRFLTTHTERLSKPETQKQYNRLLKSIVTPKLGKKKLKEVTLNDIERLHAAHEDTPYQANRMLAILSKLFNQAEKWGERDQGSNPCRHVDRYPEKSRERFLSGDELRNLAATLNASWPEENSGQNSETTPLASPHCIAAIWLLLLTGARLNEILTLKWEFLSDDLTSARLPDSKTGTKTIYFSEPAQNILQRLPKIEGNEFVIAGRKEGRHLVNLRKPWQRILDAANIRDARLHDLRHTYASYGAMNGLNQPLLMKLLHHTQSQTTEKYLHLQDAPLHIGNAQIVDAMFEEINKT